MMVGRSVEVMRPRPGMNPTGYKAAPRERGSATECAIQARLIGRHFVAQQFIAGCLRRK